MKYSGFHKEWRFLLMLLALVTLFVVACKKDKINEPVKKKELLTDSITDVEGNAYTIVKIGEQWWMAENLKTKKYRNGTAIPGVTTDTAKWRKDSVGSYSKIDNSNPAIDYGLLYNWHAVNNPNILAPAGWHIPTDDEWKQLEEYLGLAVEEAGNTGWRGDNIAEFLKIEEFTDWVEYKDVWQTNESGFTALAGACRLFNGVWGYPGIRHTGYWWTSSTTGNNAWYRHLDYKHKNIFRYNCHKNYGYSVRCVKD